MQYWPAQFFFTFYDDALSMLDFDWFIYLFLDQFLQTGKSFTFCFHGRS